MIGLLFAVVIVMGIVKGNKNENQINGLTDHIEDLDRTFHEKVSDCNRWIDERTLMVDRRVDQEIDRTNRIHEDVIKYIDSRIDKLETKLTGTTGAKQVLKG
jgi:DNA polymerase II small subunit/DNA polymerase delta subunit B